MQEKRTPKDFLIGKNRVYFAKTARHINNYRNHALVNKPLGFECSKDFWSNPNLPKTSDWKSTHILCGYLLNSFTSLMLFATVWFFMQSVNCDAMWIPFVFSLLSLLVSFSASKLLMK